VQATAGGHRGDAQHRRDLGRLQLLATGEEEDLAVLLLQALESADDRAGGIGRGVARDRRRQLTAEPVG
jgi:hypothetical protein